MGRGQGERECPSCLEGWVGTGSALVPEASAVTLGDRRYCSLLLCYLSEKACDLLRVLQQESVKPDPDLGLGVVWWSGSGA